MNSAYYYGLLTCKREIRSPCCCSQVEQFLREPVIIIIGLLTVKGEILALAAALKQFFFFYVLTARGSDRCLDFADRRIVCAAICVWGKDVHIRGTMFTHV